MSVTFLSIFQATGSVPQSLISVSQLTDGGAGTEAAPVASTVTSSVTVEAGALIEVDIVAYPTTAPDALSFTITGLGLTFVQQHSVEASEYGQMLRYRAEASSGASGTLTITSDADFNYMLYAVKQWTGQVQGNNGADAYVQTNGIRNANSTTLSAFASADNRVSAAFYGSYFPSQSGTVDATLVEIASFSYTPITDFRFVTATGEDDSPYSITWDNTPYIQAAIASEIAAA